MYLEHKALGKTIFMVKKAFEMSRRGRVVYSNLKLNFKFEQLDYQDIIDCNLKNSVVILDECHLLLPSRNCLSKTSRLICDNFLSMARKQNTEIFASTQTSRKIDVRFREEADFWYYCTRWVYDDNLRRWVEVLHNQNLSVKTPVMIYVRVVDMNSRREIRFAFRANPYYSLYDTFEVVKIRGI